MRASQQTDVACALAAASAAAALWPCCGLQSAWLVSSEVCERRVGERISAPSPARTICSVERHNKAFRGDETLSSMQYCMYCEYATLPIMQPPDFGPGRAFDPDPDLNFKLRLHNFYWVTPLQYDYESLI